MVISVVGLLLLVSFYSLAVCIFAWLGKYARLAASAWVRIHNLIHAGRILPCVRLSHLFVADCRCECIVSLWLNLSWLQYTVVYSNVVKQCVGLSPRWILSLWYDMIWYGMTWKWVVWWFSMSLTAVKVTVTRVIVAVVCEMDYQ